MYFWYSLKKQIHVYTCVHVYTHQQCTEFETDSLTSQTCTCICTMYMYTCTQTTDL